jgi:type II secretory pathway pseudopilin PulG
MSRLRSEGGFTLIETLVCSVIFVAVLTATLDSTALFNRLNHENQQVNDQSDRARRGVDRGMRQLRNLARRIDAPVISRATSSDFIFQTSDPARTWVRYCLETRQNGDVRLWALTTPGSVTTAMSGPCPGTGWPGGQVVSTNVTNTTPQRSIPLFTFSCVAGAPVTCPSSSADFGRIRTVGMDLLVDDNPDTDPPESRVTSSVYLRNQNEPPTAAVSWRPSASRQIILNASASLDPEGRNLRFLWFRAPAPSFTCDLPPALDVMLWSGVTYTHTFLPTEGVPGTQKNMELVVCDPGGLQARATVTVTIP